MNVVNTALPGSGVSRRGSMAMLVWFSFASSLPLIAEIKLPAPATGTVDYMTHVKPILKKNCYECHGNEKQQAGLRLDLRQNALRGGDYGPVIVPGKSDESRLIRKVLDGDGGEDRKSTRLNSSHLVISYAVFCLKKTRQAIAP